jgi:hypothetical protein
MRIESGRVVAPAVERSWKEAVAPIAKRLYLEVHEPSPGRLLLVHRDGWPFDLRTIDGDPIGRTVEELPPTGAGDEVFRDLLETFSRENPGLGLHVYGEEEG